MISFFIPGKPATAGSKRGFVNKHSGRVIMVPDNKRAAPWTSEVKAAAMKAMQDAERFDTGALSLEVTFLLQRPKGHYSKKGLKLNAPVYVRTKPDTTKLVRCLEDALTGICWHDDSQVAVQRNQKLYASGEQVPGVIVSIDRIEQ